MYLTRNGIAKMESKNTILKLRMPFKKQYEQGSVPEKDKIIEYNQN